MRKILVVRNDRFGEFLLNVPAFRAIRETYPRAEIHAAVAGGVKELAQAVSFIDKVIVFPSEGESFIDQAGFVLHVRRERFDAAVVLNPTARTHWMTFLAGIPFRAGYARKHHFLLTHTVEDLKGLGQKHEVESNCALVALLGCYTQDLSLVLRIPPEVEAGVIRRWGLDPVARYVAVHPWTSDPVKQWPVENFEKLVSALAGGSIRVVIIGRPEPWHKECVVPEGANVIDARGKTSLLEAAAILKHCSVLVSCDSGPVHLAASVGTPVVALFRNDMPGKNPQRWGPWPLTGKGHAVIQKPRLEDITVDEVFMQVGKVF